LERPALGSLRRMEHELSLKAELNPEWAVRPLALTEHQGRAMLSRTPAENLSICSLQGRWSGDRLCAWPSAFAQHLPRLHGRGLIHKESSPRMFLSILLRARFG
jgi:hypothetical protein